MRRQTAEFPAAQCKGIEKMDTVNQADEMNVSNEIVAGDAYERVKADLAAVKADELIQLNLDVTPAVTTVLGVLPEIKALRERIVKELPTFDLASFDKLEDYALALSSTHTDVLTATTPPDDLTGVVAEASDMRDRLAADSKALAAHKLLDLTPLGQLKGGTGYKSLAQDLQVLSKVMQDSWPQIQGKSATTADDLKTANQMSTRLMRIVGLRERSPAIVATASEARLRAFTQLIHVYEDARRAVTYLRAAEGDADTIAPSLYPGRPRRRTTDTVAAAPTDPQVPAAGASTTLAAPGVGNATSTTVPALSPAAVAAAVAAQKGAPASKDPFLS
jgi:hypothetical protein